MHLKAILLCDDVRVEMGGTLTLVGVYNDRLIAPAGPADAPIEMARLVVVAVAAGLEGVRQLEVCHRIQRVGDPNRDRPRFETHRHDPESAEHNFIFSQAPMVFAQPGRYEVVLDLDAGGDPKTFHYRFAIERR